MKFQKPKGTKDVLPRDIHKWHYVENVIADVTKLFNFDEIRTPTFEFTELFARSGGTETDVVGKEMYTFVDKNNDSLTLRPEGTAPVMRALIENSLSAESPIHKLYYYCNMFRHEKPQAGRYREHTQFGAETIGSDSIYTDVELILLAKEIFNRCGVNNFKVKINSIGKPGERNDYIKSLQNYLSTRLNDLSDDSKRRFNTNPLRILDSKNDNDRKITENAPKIIDNLTAESRSRFEKVLNQLSVMKVDYEVDFRLVRGFDYYTDTTFEFISQALGAQDALGGGGRYDGLIALLGGKPSPGAGFASGIERVIIVAEKNGFKFGKSFHPKIYFITIEQSAGEVAANLINQLRQADVSCDTDYLGRSLKAQMREANKMNTEFAFIIGADEIRKGSGILKNMNDGTQIEIEFEKLVDHFKTKD